MDIYNKYLHLDCNRRSQSNYHSEPTMVRSIKRLTTPSATHTEDVATPGEDVMTIGEEVMTMVRMS